jgi:lipopolysaccharide transport system permease protein
MPIGGRVAVLSTGRDGLFSWAMAETVFSAAPELRRPGRFLAAAAADLAAALPIAFRMSRSNIRVRYRRSWFGYVWLLLPALGTAAICAFIQSRRIIAVAPTELPYPLFVLAGMIFWQIFVEALNAPLQQLQAGRQLATRSRVPHEALILAGVLEIALNAAVRLAVLAAAVIVFRIAPAAEMLFVPLGLLALATLGLGLGLLIAPIGLLYDDVGRAVALATSLGFFLTPVVYPLPGDSLLRFNPVAPLLATTRGWIAGAAPAPGFFALTAAAAAALLVGWLFYRVARPHLVSRLG